MAESIVSTSSVSNLASKITRAFSPNRTDARGRTGGDSEPIFHSSGRGGAGNIRRSSASRDARPADGPDDFSTARGRELAHHPQPTEKVAFVTSGRGGAGNYRSPSRDPAKARKELEQETKVVDAAARRAEESGVIASSGRGGYGNFHQRASLDRSRSRSKSRGPSLDYSPTLNGGVPLNRQELDKLEEEDRKAAVDV